MITHLTFELNDDLIKLWLDDNPTKSQDDFIKEFNNLLYLGGDCTNAMMERMMEISVDFYVETNKFQKGDLMGDLMRNEDSETYAKIMAGK
jgi:hypothetical protein